MSLELAVRHALQNPIKSRGRSSISRFGVVLTDGFRTVKSWNSYKTHPLQAHFAAQTGNPCKLSIHAEVAAIAKAFDVQRLEREQDLSRFKMYVARVLADDSLGLAMPCPSCWAAITEFGIKYVEWTE